MGLISGVELTPLKIIKNPSGDVFHALKSNETSFKGFGEAYFSTVNKGVAKGWKKHSRMTLNLIVPAGSIQFVLFDDRPESITYKTLQEIELSIDNYQRMTVPPGIWMAFKGTGENRNILLNIADIPHDPSETESLFLVNDIIPYSGFIA